MTIIYFENDNLVLKDLETNQALVYKDTQEARSCLENMIQKLDRFIENGVAGFEGKKWLNISVLVDIGKEQIILDKFEKYKKELELLI